MAVSFIPPDTSSGRKSKYLDPLTLRYKFRENIDTAILIISNTGERAFYFNIIDIDPNENVNVMLPSLDRPISECYLKPGQKFQISSTFSKPYGTERLKIITSGKKFDLRPVIKYPEKTRGGDGDLESFFYGTTLMRGGASRTESDEFATFNVFFDVIKP